MECPITPLEMKLSDSQEEQQINEAIKLINEQLLNDIKGREYYTIIINLVDGIKTKVFDAFRKSGWRVVYSTVLNNRFYLYVR